MPRPLSARTIRVPPGRRSRRLRVFHQLLPFATGIPGGRVARRKRLHRGFFHNVQHFFLRKSLPPITPCPVPPSCIPFPHTPPPTPNPPASYEASRKRALH